MWSTLSSRNFFDQGRKPPVTITVGQVLTLIATVPGVRDRAIVSLMLGSGLRGCDVASIDIANVDLDAGLVTVVDCGPASDRLAGKRLRRPQP